MTRSAIGGGTAAVFLTLAVAGCSIATAPATYPQSATSPLDSPQPLCRVTGPPEVLAKRVFVPRGVEAIERGGAFEVRFARDRAQCLAVEWSSPGQTPTESPCPSSDGPSIAGAGRDDEAMLACESSARDPDRVDVVSDAVQAVVLATPRQDLETVIAHHPRSRLGAEYGSGAAPVVLPVDDEQYLSLWVEGGVESHDLFTPPALLRPEVTGMRAIPAGPTIDLPHRRMSAG